MDTMTPRAPGAPAAAEQEPWGGGKPIRALVPLGEPYRGPDWRITLGDQLTPEEEDYELAWIERSGYRVLRTLPRLRADGTRWPYTHLITVADAAGVEHDYAAKLGLRDPEAQVAHFGERLAPAMLAALRAKRAAEALRRQEALAPSAPTTPPDDA